MLIIKQRGFTYDLLIKVIKKYQIYKTYIFSNLLLLKEQITRKEVISSGSTEFSIFTG